MAYYESSQGVVFSKKRAIKELKDHGYWDKEDDDYFIDCFLREMGDKKNYNESEVLDWMGC